MAQPGLPGSQFPSEDDLVRRLKDLQRDVQQFSAANVLATAGISVIADGLIVDGLMEFRREDGTRGVSVDPSNGTFIAYDFSGEGPVARFGALEETAPPGFYGVEVLVGTTWVRLGDQTTTWESFTKPSTYNTGNFKWAPDAHTHPGGDVTSRVASATDAIGSASGWANNVAGTEFYAVWVGNDGNWSFGRNTSAMKYKENLRQLDGDDSVLDINEYLFDRKPQYKYPEDEDGNRLEGPAEEVLGAKDEYGTIANYSACPELVTWFQGEIDGFRYDLVGLRLIPVIRRQRDRIAALEQQNTEQAADIAALKQAVRDLGGNI